MDRKSELSSTALVPRHGDGCLPCPWSLFTLNSTPLQSLTPSKLVRIPRVASNRSALNTSSKIREDLLENSLPGGQGTVGFTGAWKTPRAFSLPRFLSPLECGSSAPQLRFLNSQAAATRAASQFLRWRNGHSRGCRLCKSQGRIRTESAQTS